MFPVADCPHQRAQLEEYLNGFLLCDIDQFITPCGGVRTNLVETVWKSFLKFRTKDTNIGGDQYRMISNIACASFNQPLIMQHAGYHDYCYQQRVCDLLNVPVPQATKRKWNHANQARMCQSKKRRTAEYRIKQAGAKAKRRTQVAADKQQREEEEKAAAALGKEIGTYISGGSGSARYGVAAGKPKAKPKSKGKGKGKAPAKKTRICARPGCTYVCKGRKRICTYCADES